MRLDKKGFAISSIIYSILILFLLLIFGVLSLLGSRKAISDKLKNDVMDNLNGDKIEENKPIDYVDASGASKPELTDKLIPVIYDGTVWKVADKTQKWYDYDKQEWANAVILNNGVTKAVGQPLDLNTDVAMMYVWIPRYEYKLPTGANGVGTTGTPDPINIQFIDSSKTTADIDYAIHPGFTFDSKAQNGIWIGKFETTTTDATCLSNSSSANCNKVQGIKILPNSDSLRYITPSNIFNSSRQSQTDYGLTGLDIHMSKYTEWTAVSYLTNSKYGRCTEDTCTEVTINNYYKNSTTYNTITGCAGTSISANETTACSYTYEKKEGQLASTTGNITGVYDMSGGAYEYVMGVATSGTSFYDSSGFSSTQSPATYDKLPNKKYYDEFGLNGLHSYLYDDLISYNGINNFSGILNELQIDKTQNLNWFGDYAYSASNDGPWIVLGGYYGYTTRAGIFASYYSDGGQYGNYGSRITITVEK